MPVAVSDSLRIKILAHIIGSALLVCACSTFAMITDAHIHDPSTVIKREGVYYVYGSGHGIQQLSSTDRQHWIRCGAVFSSAPEWIADAVPHNKNNFAWAPDIHFFNNEYYLYYCYSTFGKRVSAIGCATNHTLDPKTWIDQGEVIASTDRDGFNAIDPCIFSDSKRGMWLVFGSYFRGIKMIEIDPKSGKQLVSNRTIYNVAQNTGDPIKSCEAPCVYYHNHYYYLWVNWGTCCTGNKSTYNIRIGRSKDPFGPFVDKSGRDMEEGGGTLFLGSVPDDGTGSAYDDNVGPGHASILDDHDGYWFGCHYEWSRQNNGASTLALIKLDWGKDGWPVLVQ